MHDWWKSVFLWQSVTSRDGSLKDIDLLKFLKSLNIFIGSLWWQGTEIQFKKPSSKEKKFKKRHLLTSLRRLRVMQLLATLISRKDSSYFSMLSFSIVWFRYQLCYWLHFSVSLCSNKVSDFSMYLLLCSECLCLPQIHILNLPNPQGILKGWVLGKRLGHQSGSPHECYHTLMKTAWESSLEKMPFKNQEVTLTNIEPDCSVPRALTSRLQKCEREISSFISSQSVREVWASLL